jgi:glycosyltransferase involved in cell wall biosynthesis
LRYIIDAIDRCPLEAVGTRKVLIIGYHFSNANHVASRRLHGLWKFLPQSGWEPTVITAKITADAAGGSSRPLQRSIASSAPGIIEIPFEDEIVRFKRKLGIPTNEPVRRSILSGSRQDKKTALDIGLNLWREVFTYPDAQKSWLKPALNAAEGLFREESYEAVISSSAPFTSHIIAHRLKEKFGVPWIADLRDLWTQNHDYPFSPLRRFLERRLEVSTLKSADALVTVSEPLCRQLRDLHRNKTVCMITNGFDPDDISTNNCVAHGFNIIYTGSLYKRGQSPVPLFKAIKKLISQGVMEPQDVKIEFYGYPTDGWLEREIEMHGLSEIVKTYGMISRKETVEKQRSTQVLLLLAWNSPGGVGVYTGKTFEYLAARRPILGIGVAGSVIEDLLAKTQAGKYASSQDEVEEIILEFYREFKKDGQVAYRGVDSEIDRYSQKAMAKRFTALLDKEVSRYLDQYGRDTN